jgi:ATP-dependent DNA ligase
VRLYSRNAYDWTVRLATIASAAEQIKAKSFTIDGEAVVLYILRCRHSADRARDRTAMTRQSPLSTGCEVLIEWNNP